MLLSCFLFFLFPFFSFFLFFLSFAPEIYYLICLVDIIIEDLYTQMHTWVYFFFLKIFDTDISETYVDTSDISEIYSTYNLKAKLKELLRSSVQNLIKDLIKQHHLFYLDLFDKNLTPKMHLNIHYPDIIPEIDPLEPLSYIRMEAKHREGKQIAYLSTNRINLSYSIAKRYQLKFCCQLPAERGLSLKISFSSIQTINITEAKEFPKFRHIFFEDICSAK